MTLGCEVRDNVETLLIRQANAFNLPAVMEALPAALFTTDKLGCIEQYNKQAVAFWGAEPEPQDRTWYQSWKFYYPDGGQMRHEECPMERALKSRQTIKGEGIVAKRPDGSWVTFSAHSAPLRDSSENILGAVNLILDIIETATAEAALNTRLRHLQAINDLSLIALRNEGLQALFDQTAIRLSEALDVEFTEVLKVQPGTPELFRHAGTGWQSGAFETAASSADQEGQAGYTLLANQPVIVSDLGRERRFEASRLLLGHDIASGVSVVIKGDDQHIHGVLAAYASSKRIFTTQDVHLLQVFATILARAIERSNRDDTQRMLVSELSHRVKNNLSVIQSIARQTGRNAESIADYQQSFDKRLVSLSHAHDLLTAAAWSGTQLSTLAEKILQCQANEASLHLDIEDALLNAAGTQAVTMVLHELMTNALKYGALCGSNGKVTLTGRRKRDGNDDLYHLIWHESGGPSVKEPTRMGFGSRLINATVEAQRGGKVAFSWHPDGLVVDCVLPIAAIQAPD